MKVLVTGCAGFIGSWLVKTLAVRGDEVYGCDDYSNPCDQPVEGAQRVSVMDLSSAHNAQLVLQTVKPEILYHLAANARESASQFQPTDVTRRNMMAFVNTLEAAIQCGVKKVIFFSSIARYGNIDPPFSEGCWPTPIDVYGVNKVACERILQILADVHGFRWTILVPHNVFGPGQSLSDPYRNVLGIWMNQIMRGESVTIYGGGSQTRGFTYIEDILPACLWAITPYADSEIINIGHNQPVTINELLEAVLVEFPDKVPNVTRLPARPHEVQHAWCLSTKLRGLLGEHAGEIGWRAGVTRMARWAREHGPQDWRTDYLPLLNDRAPLPWRERSCVSR